MMMSRLVGEFGQVVNKESNLPHGLFDFFHHGLEAVAIASGHRRYFFLFIRIVDEKRIYKIPVCVYLFAVCLVAVL